MTGILKKLKHKKWLQPAILVLLIVIFSTALYFVVENFEIMKLQGEMHISLRRRGIKQAPDVSQIRGWMTFRYINLVFNLQPDYLKNSLDITDKRYPNVSINSLAKTQKITSQSILQTVVSLLNPSK